MTSVRSAENQASAPLLKLFIADLRSYWPLWSIVALAIFLRVYELHRVPGMHGDEAWYGLQARLWLSGQEIEWRTPTGNVPGMLQLWSLILLHAVFSPSLMLLRLPALLSSVAALFLAYAIGRRFFGAAAAASAALLMACFPINIAYARLGWDPSHSPLLVLAAAYAAFAGRKLLCALLFALAITNHPSAVFVAPFLTLGFLGFAVRRHGLRQALGHSAQQAALLLLAILLGVALSPGTTHYLSAARSLVRLFDLSAWIEFAQMFGRLLSGDTVYSYVAGEGLGAARPWADWAVAFGMVAVLAAAVLGLRQRWDWPTAGLLAGWLVSLALLYLVAGLWVMSPNLERFAFPMVPLTALTVAAVVGPILAGNRQWVQLLLAAVGLSLVAGFWFYYLSPLKTGDIRPVQGFWTARQDPSLSAYQRIATAAPKGRVRIIVEDWWLRVPISYYAAGQPYDVVDSSARRQSPDSSAEPSSWVVYAGGPLDQALARRGDIIRRWTIPTAHPDNRLHIWWRQPGHGVPDPATPDATGPTRIEPPDRR